MKLNFNLKKASFMKNGHLFGHGTSPDADWKIIFTCMASISLIVLAIGLYIFVQVERGQLFTVQEQDAAETPKLDKNLLSKTVNYYQTKANTFENIKVSKEVVKDPSL